MNNQQIEQYRKILADAPEGATHYTDPNPALNLYFKLVHLDGMYAWLCGKWERFPPHGALLAISEIQTIGKRFRTTKI